MMTSRSARRTALAVRPKKQEQCPSCTDSQGAVPISSKRAPSPVRNAWASSGAAPMDSGGPRICSTPYNDTRFPHQRREYQPKHNSSGTAARSQSAPSPSKPSAVFAAKERDWGWLDTAPRHREADFREPSRRRQETEAEAIVRFKASASENRFSCEAIEARMLERGNSRMVENNLARVKHAKLQLPLQQIGTLPYDLGKLDITMLDPAWERTADAMGD